MIKKFKQFISEMYNKHEDNLVNEAFQSSKLRELIKQHGKPKYGSDYKILYDIKDKYIIDIINSPFLRNEQKEEYERKNAGKNIREINLEDDTTIVLALTDKENSLLYPQHIKSHYSDGAYFIEPRNSYAKERHKGNLGKNNGDDIHKKHSKNVGDIKLKRFAAKIYHKLSEIDETIKAEMERIKPSDLDKNGKITKEFYITLGSDKYVINAEYEVEFSNGRKKYSTYYYDITYTLTSFDMWYEEADEADEYNTNVMLGITDDTYPDLFEPITIYDVEGDTYGVNKKNTIMIKTFEQFVNECYNKPEGNLVNEAFQSSKLREIIKQHGKPKRNWDKKLLYDLKDNEIIDVLDNRKEYWKKYSDDDEGQATFIIELEDDTVIVISNLGILNSRWGDIEDKKDKVFKKRYDERHKGKLINRGDEIHSKHLENVNKIESRRLADKLQANVPEIIKNAESMFYDIDLSEIDVENIRGVIEDSLESEIILNGDKYTLYVDYDISCSNDEHRKYGGEYYTVYLNFNGFELLNEDGDILISNEDLGVTRETHKDLFKEYEREVLTNIYDYYDYYGVSRSDFY